MKNQTLFSFMFSAFIFVAILFLIGCTTDKTPTGIINTDEIDEAIVGDWIHESVNLAVGSAPVSISGIKISASGEIEDLAIETATGKLVKTNSPSPGYFIYASNGSCVLKANRIGFALGGTYSFQYKAENSHLQFYEQMGTVPVLRSDYTKSKVGEIVTQPVHSYFEMALKDTVLVNSPVGSFPSAYASYLIPNNHQPSLSIHSQSGPHRLHIHIGNFQSTGTYILGSNTENSGEYAIWGGDAGIGYWTLEPNSGSITLDSIDLSAYSCSGSFNFEVSDGQTTFMINGYFEIPVYE